MSDTNTAYINTLDYKNLEDKLAEKVSIMDDFARRNSIERKARYMEIDIQQERAAGRIAPDEVFVPQHIIDTNIRREQASYVQYVTQSNRVCVFQDINEPSIDTTLLERDFTNRVRYDDWQTPMFANIDGFQQSGRAILELVYDETKPGNIAYEVVALGDFGFSIDSKHLQEDEMLVRCYYFTKTALLDMVGGKWEFDAKQVKNVIDTAPDSSYDTQATTKGDKSLYRIQKVMWRVNGVVQVAWSCYKRCTDWLRGPRPLFIGRKEAIPATDIPILGAVLPPQYKDAYETDYPYFLFPYLISENSTIDKLKGRAYLDQDTQSSAVSLISSYCTAMRRASGFYASKDNSDPNTQLGMQKNVYLKQGVLIDERIKQFQLNYPDPSMLSAVNALISANQAETSKVNFAAQNRKDSRKTATEIQAATQEASTLSTVQVVLFSIALKNLYTASFEIISSRVAAGLIEVNDRLKALYGRYYSIRPAGDVDVIERQQMIATMEKAWPVVQNTPVGPMFLMDLLLKMFPDSGPRYVQALQQAQMEQQSQQAQQQQAMLGQAVQIGQQLIQLSKRTEMFSDTGRVYALPAIIQVAQQLEQIIPKQQQQQQQ